MVKERVCNSCGKTYPLTSEFFHTNNYGKGFRYQCKKCRNGMKRKNDHESTLKEILALRCRKAIQRAKHRNMDYNITPEFLMEMWKLQDGKCFYSGLQMSYDINDLYTVSLDRIDSNKGYTKDNVVLSCWSINSMKNNYSIPDFVSLCKAVAHYQQLK